jgi:ATP-binding cassette, subfamily F, member 3
MQSIDALISALQQYQGTLVFISHDVYFIRAIAQQVVHVRGGRLQRYPGGYEYYLERTKPVSERAGLTAGDAAPRMAKTGSSGATNGGPRMDRKEQKRLEAEQRQSRSKEKRAEHQYVRELEKQIQQLEARQIELAAELEKPESYEGGRAMQINRELMEVVDALAAKTPEWEAAATKLNADAAQAATA